MIAPENPQILHPRGPTLVRCPCLAPGEVDWVELSERVHRAVNVGKFPFEEVITFFLDRPDAVPQLEDAPKLPRHSVFGVKGSEVRRKERGPRGVVAG